jgi:hypothetical protein
MQAGPVKGSTGRTPTDIAHRLAASLAAFVHPTSAPPSDGVTTSGRPRPPSRRRNIVRATVQALATTEPRRTTLRPGSSHATFPSWTPT